MFSLFKDIAVIGTISVSSIFLQVTPDSVSGWEKIGVIGILVAAIVCLIIERQFMQNKMLSEIQKLHDDIKDQKKEVEELQKVNGLTLDRLWNERIKEGR
jgi:cell division protein FtsL